MIRRPIFIGCDSCNIERAPTPGEDREKLADAFARAREERWTIRRNGQVIYCPACMGIDADINVAIDIEVDAKVGVVGLQIVPLD